MENFCLLLTLPMGNNSSALGETDLNISENWESGLKMMSFEWIMRRLLFDFEDVNNWTPFNF